MAVRSHQAKVIHANVVFTVRNGINTLFATIAGKPGLKVLQRDPEFAAKGRFVVDHAPSVEGHL